MQFRTKQHNEVFSINTRYFESPGSIVMKALWTTACVQHRSPQILSTDFVLAVFHSQSPHDKFHCTHSCSSIVAAFHQTSSSSHLLPLTTVFFSFLGGGLSCDLYIQCAVIQDVCLQWVTSLDARCKKINTAHTATHCLKICSEQPLLRFETPVFWPCWKLRGFDLRSTNQIKWILHVWQWNVYVI